jgi:LysM domain
VRSKEVFCGLAAMTLAAAVSSSAQDAPPQGAAARAAAARKARETRETATAPAADASAGLKTGPATIARHWSKYKYPESIPEGAVYYIIVRGDTLWDLAGRYLGNPFLWPQIWDQNRYITDAHWIYPGDPLIMPKIALISEKAGEAGLGLEEEPVAGEGLPGEAGRAVGSELGPVTEEVTLQCAYYVVGDREDESLRIIGSEAGNTKVSFADRDILYVNKGSNAGIKAGDFYTMHHSAYAVKHPVSNRVIGTKVETSGWVQVILVQENTAIAVVEQACADIHAGDYLKPFEKVNVPLVLSRPPANRLTPPSGKLDRYVVDIADDATIAGQGQILTIDAGSDSGISPGNVFSVYRIVYPSVPTPRNVLGEVTVIAVRERTATAKVTYSADAIMVGDQVELR